jgi:LysM repeat protein
VKNKFRGFDKMALGLDRHRTMPRYTIVIFLCLGLLFSSPIKAQSSRSLSTKDYIDSFKGFAMQEMRANGVPASITLGQGILESASGNSRLSKECNNHFGIKCRKNWTGNFCLADDDAKDECFRGYESVYESYRDHSLFLKNSRRYDFLFELSPLDYESWSHGLQKAGYATNPAYGNILTRIIEKYRLSHFDSLVVIGNDYFNGSAGNPMVVNGIPAIAAKSGDTPESIAKEQKLAEWKIYKYNDLQRDDFINPGEILYLKPKRKTASENTHIVKRGETLHDVSQMYAIKLKSLRKLNQLSSGEEPQIGEEVNLSEKRANPPKVVTGKVPMSTAVQVLQAKGPTNDQVHEVVAGETIESIADKYRTSVLNLVRWNDLEFAEVRIGQFLVLAPGIKSSAEVRSVSENEDNLKAQTHTVMRGETVYSIARMYKIDPQQIINANPRLSKGGSLLADETIRLKSDGKPSANSETVPERASIHYVKPGETLFGISQKYGVSVEAIKAQNRLQTNALWAGQKLKLP